MVVKKRVGTNKQILVPLKNFSNFKARFRVEKTRANHVNLKGFFVIPKFFAIYKVGYTVPTYRSNRFLKKKAVP
jgi:hypothetical protein